MNARADILLEDLVWGDEGTQWAAQQLIALKGGGLWEKKIGTSWRKVEGIGYKCKARSEKHCNKVKSWHEGRRRELADPTDGVE